MNINDKDLNLLHKLIHDRRKNKNGIITKLCINKAICNNGYYCYYEASMDRIGGYEIIHIEDFISGNIVFLLPFNTRWDEEYEEIRQQSIKDIKECFGEDFREDMIIRVSEEERQKKIKEEEKIIRGFLNWEGVKIE